MGTFANVVCDSASYDALIADHCLPPTETSVCGIGRHERFEDLTPDQIQQLNDYFAKNGSVVILRIESVGFALHVLGATEVDPAKDRYNLVRGTGKEKTYFWCEANQHNRILKSGNLGSITKEGLIYDMVNRYFGLGPVAHIDLWGWILSLQHRLIAWIKGYDETGGEMPPIDIITLVGMPPQLAATLDRGAPKTGADQEFIDRGQFTVEDLRTWLEYVPEDTEKLRNELAGYLVTVRNNLYSRLNGHNYHPSKPQQPSTREARDLQRCFADDGKALERLIAEVWSRSLTEDGKKGLWVKHLPVPMVVTACILASNVDSSQWEPGTPIAIDSDIVEKILNGLGQCSDEGSEGYSSFLRECARVKKQPKKPSGLIRWVFWGFVEATVDLLNDSYNPDGSYFPSVTTTLVKRVKEGKDSWPIFGGLDCGPVEDNED